MLDINRGISNSILVIALAAIPARTLSARLAPSHAGPAQAQTQSAITQQVGTVKAINGNTLTLTSDAEQKLPVTVQDTTKIVQVAPGQKDLKSAVPIHLTDLQPGDRILVRSRTSPDAKTPHGRGHYCHESHRRRGETIAGARRLAKAGNRWPGERG